jgi:predicted ribonuclease YlaK
MFMNTTISNKLLQNPRSTVPYRYAHSKIFVFDATTLRNNPDIILQEQFKDSAIVIHIDTLREIHFSKEYFTNMPHLGGKNRILNHLQTLSTKRGSLSLGVCLENRSSVYVDMEVTHTSKSALSTGALETTLVMAQKITQANEHAIVTFVTDSAFAHIIATGQYNLVAQKYASSLYTGLATMTLKDTFDVAAITAYGKMSICLGDDDFEERGSVSALKLNQCCIIIYPLTTESDVPPLLAIYKGANTFLIVRPYQTVKTGDVKKNRVIKPRNNEQQFLMTLTDDKELWLRIFFGPPGVGKTLPLLYTLLNRSDKPKIHFFVPLVSVDKDLGPVPGDLQEKTLQYKTNVIQVLSRLGYTERSLGSRFVIESINNIAGTTIGDPLDSNGKTVIVLDEVQLWDLDNLLKVCSRAGENAEICMMGDPAQRHKNVHGPKNLEHFINSLQGQERVSILNLTKIERSPLVALIMQVCC